MTTTDTHISDRPQDARPPDKSYLANRILIQAWFSAVNIGKAYRTCN